MPPEQTFFQKHREGIVAIWRRDTREWWRRHYVTTHGEDPPMAWWQVNAATAAGGQIEPGLMRSFGCFDDAIKGSYLREMEARYRSEAGLPARGEGWVSETHLAHLVAEALPGTEVIREARLPWLNGQRLDIFIPSLAVAIEYQGIQHYEPIDLFGGPEALLKRQGMDAKKRDACRAAAIRLIEWRYDERIDMSQVQIRLGLTDS